jgi:urease accessory protein
MLEIQTLLCALQNADSFFPSGSVSFSSGLETLHRDGQVSSADELAAFVAGQLQHRWASCDMVAMIAAFRADGNLSEVCEVDAIVEATVLASELRDGSKRAGASLLTVHSKLGTDGAAAYRNLIRDAKAFGHLPVVQGMLWRAAGMSEDSCRAVSAHTLCTGLVSAALRLGMIGHLDAQKVLLRVRPLLVELLRLPVADREEMYAYNPATEIAAMRHEVQDARVFAN